MLTVEQAEHTRRILSPEAAAVLRQADKDVLFPRLPEGMPAEFWEGYALALLDVHPLLKTDASVMMAWMLLGAGAAHRYQDAFPSTIPE